jgi:endonuclease/exonuclease/phosphatase family metal-dependent hydrolase
MGDKKIIGSGTQKTAKNKMTLLTDHTIKIATFNLFNYLEPPNAYYEFNNIYSTEQWQKKQRWIEDYLAEQQADIIGFQEVFSPQSLEKLVAEQGYPYFAVIDQAKVTDGFIFHSPVVAIASRFPIVETSAVVPDTDLANTIGLSDDFSFSRQVLRATIDLPHIGDCDCYVVHFKSKRSLIEFEQDKNVSFEKNIIEKLKGQIAGEWGSTVKRGSEATLLFVSMIEQKEKTARPMLLMGDFNNELTDGVLNQLLTNKLRFSGDDKAKLFTKYCLKDSWDLYKTYTGDDKYSENEKGDEIFPAEVVKNNIRKATHYFGGSSSVLDYILLSYEFDANNQKSFFEVSAYETYDRHLINPLFDRDGNSTDHGIVMITLTLRE